MSRKETRIRLAELGLTEITTSGIPKSTRKVLNKLGKNSKLGTRNYFLKSLFMKIEKAYNAGEKSITFEF